MTKTNEDGFTREEIDTTCAVLSELTDCSIGTHESDMIDVVIDIVQQYDQDSEWRGEKPADTIDEDNYQTLETIGGG